MAAVKSFSTAAGSDEPIVGEIVDGADDESCAEEPAMCANKSVGETEKMSLPMKQKIMSLPMLSPEPMKPQTSMKPVTKAQFSKIQSALQMMGW